MTQKAKIIKDDERNLSDTLENLVSNLGTSLDKNSHSVVTDNPELSGSASRKRLSDLYRNDWISGKVVDIIPDDMTRQWRKFNGDITPEQIEQLEKEEKRIQLQPKINRAHKWARLYGTSFLVLSVNDGLDPDKPLNLDNIKKGGLRHIQPVDRFRIQNADSQVISDPLEANYGLPEFYRFNDSNSPKIHHSRILRFDGVELAFDDFRENGYFSDSVLKRIHDSIINFKTATASSSSLIHEATINVVKFKGLMNALSNPETEKLVMKRFTLANLMKSLNNMMLLDSDEEFTSTNNTFSGLPDLIDRFSKILASASDIPATRLLGDSPSGLNATGEGDMRNYHDKIKSLQVIEYGPKLDKLDKVMAKSLGFSDDADLSYEFNPLLQMNEAEQAELDNKKAQRDQVYFNIGAIDEVIIAKELQENGTYSNIDDKFIEELESAVEEFENEFETSPTEGENQLKHQSQEEEEEEDQSSKTE